LACHRLTTCHSADFHPDPFYKIYSSIDEDGACHRGHGPAGFYGAETSDCDSPISLINATFDWIRDELKDSIDFVIWTGDSARHDNDEKIPRNVQQVTQLNQLLVNKFYEVFGKDQQEPDDDPTNDLVIPVIPTFGNNDILPHNIFERGPNLWTRRYLDIWRNFIPEVQKHSFDQGGWFYVEAIPNHLAVISLNSLYVFSCIYPYLPHANTILKLLFQLKLSRRWMCRQIRAWISPTRLAPYPAAIPARPQHESNHHWSRSSGSHSQQE
jgi:hypothetical protein